MKNEIERKFFVRELPDLTGVEKVSYERYFLYHEGGIELRVQRKGSKFELERKVKVSDMERTREKLEISEAEFNLLKSRAKEAIIRDSYQISDNPNISIKIYRGKHGGLVRAEVEFNSVEELQAFQPPAWFGKEITNSPLVHDAELLKLSDEALRNFLQE